MKIGEKLLNSKKYTIFFENMQKRLIFVTKFDILLKHSMNSSCAGMA